MTKTYQLWVVVRRAEDVSREWTAHCLDFDVVSQGASPMAAVAMAYEASALVAVDDLHAHRDPLDRRAPPEFWAELYSAMSHAQPLTGAGTGGLPDTGGPDACFVVQTELDILCENDKIVPPPSGSQPTLPLAFASSHACAAP